MSTEVKEVQAVEKKERKERKDYNLHGNVENINIILDRENAKTVSEIGTVWKNITSKNLTFLLNGNAMQDASAIVAERLTTAKAASDLDKVEREARYENIERDVDNAVFGGKLLETVNGLPDGEVKEKVLKRVTKQIRNFAILVDKFHNGKLLQEDGEENAE